MQSNRIIFIDYLKAIGILSIILAHTCTNPAIFQIRNFDVPLMVLISGFLAVGSFKRSLEKNRSSLSYIAKRIYRLLIPTWIFLIIFFTIMIFFPINGSYPYDINHIINSFLLLDGIGFLWIIRVFLICAFITPVIYYFNEIENNYIKFLILLTLYILYEIAIFYKINELNMVFELILAYMIPYGIIYLFGMISTKTSYKTDGLISAIFLITFAILAYILFLNTGIFQPTQLMKYPPTIYYISYALFASFLLLSIFKKIDIKQNIVIEFISKSSLWIYLWHILFLTIIPLTFGELYWIIYYLTVVIFAIFVTFIQNKIIDFLEKKNFNKSILKIFRG